MCKNLEVRIFYSGFLIKLPGQFKIGRKAKMIDAKIRPYRKYFRVLCQGGFIHIHLCINIYPIINRFVYVAFIIGRYAYFRNTALIPYFVVEKFLPVWTIYKFLIPEKSVFERIFNSIIFIEI